MTPSSQKMSISLPQPLVAAVKLEAARKDLKVSMVVRRALEAYLGKGKKR